ncbi:hypothetical protein AS850_02630 [Frondihabitans sp. 762G35]|uniref:hypothetical protein n=1 Tax=Frondihabitans sp. 762G35 TaxID=1446794 RepID=UPI000D2188C4|nr:hypothetical protein [Frondihabitans sp. 762G35]ARC55968.1 hypothetical protein AS850_02630 [Frondihabitans sp. 762G35]
MAVAASDFDIPPGVATVVVAMISLLGAYLLQKAGKRVARTRKPPQEKVNKTEFEMLREATEREFARLEGRIDDLSQKLVNRTNQVRKISATYRHLRDAFIDFVSEVNTAWGHATHPPRLSDAQKRLLDDPLEDDPDVYDTMTRAQVDAERRAISTPTDVPSPRRRPRH